MVGIPVIEILPMRSKICIQETHVLGLKHKQLKIISTLNLKALSMTTVKIFKKIFYDNYHLLNIMLELKINSNFQL